MPTLNFAATNVCLKNYTIIIIVELEKVKFDFDFDFGSIDVQRGIITVFFVSATTMYSTLALLPSKHLIACLDYSPLCLIVYLDTKNLNDHKEHNVFK